MPDVRMTIRLPIQDNQLIEMFVKTGEFSTKSDFIRQAIREYSNNHLEEVIKKAESRLKLQSLVNDIEATEEIWKP
jgi:Arc/MetJ-type ribon-helix-helix transcriptional regulator